MLKVSVVFPAAVSWVLLLHISAGFLLAAAFCVGCHIILGASYRNVQTLKREQQRYENEW